MAKHRSELQQKSITALAKPQRTDDARMLKIKLSTYRALGSSANPLHLAIVEERLVPWVQQGRAVTQIVMLKVFFIRNLTSSEKHQGQPGGTQPIGTAATLPVNHHRSIMRLIGSYRLVTYQARRLDTLSRIPSGSGQQRFEVASRRTRRGQQQGHSEAG